MNRINVALPVSFRDATGGASPVSCAGETVRQVVDDLVGKHPGLANRLLDGPTVRRFVNLYVNSEDVRVLDDLDTRLEHGDELAVIAAIAGG